MSVTLIQLLKQIQSSTLHTRSTNHKKVIISKSLEQEIIRAICSYEARSASALRARSIKHYQV